MRIRGTPSALPIDMIYFMGHRVTANEFAKLIVEEKGPAIAEDCWSESCSVEVELMTEKETSAVDDAIEKQIERVRKLLGFWELREKVFARKDHTNEIQRKIWGDTKC